MLFDVAVSATLTGHDAFSFTKEVVLNGLYSITAGTGHYSLQPIHLPGIPRDDVGNVFQRFLPRHGAELGLIKADASEEHGFASQEQAVALPFVAVGGFEGCLGCFEPIACGVGVFAHDAELTVEQSDAPFGRNGFACSGVIAAGGGNVILSGLTVQVWSSFSWLKTSFLPNQASSIRLFWALHIHDGVNTSAISLERAVWASRDLSTRGRITSPWLPVMSDGSISSLY